MVRVDLEVLAEEAPIRLDEDPDAGGEEQDGLQERGEVFDLAVPVVVFVVGGAHRDADREEGEERGREIQSGVHRFREDPQAVGGEPHDELRAREDDCRRDRGQRHRAFFVRGFRRVENSKGDLGLRGRSTPHVSILRRTMDPRESLPQSIRVS